MADMSSWTYAPTFKATSLASIDTSVFVMFKTPTPTNYEVANATVGAMPIGISDERSANPQGYGGVNPALGLVAAGPGMSLKVFMVGQPAPLRILTGPIIPGDLLSPGTGGAAIKSIAGAWVGAVALEGGTNGDIILAMPVLAYKLA